MLQLVSLSCGRRARVRLSPQLAALAAGFLAALAPYPLSEADAAGRGSTAGEPSVRVYRAFADTYVDARRPSARLGVRPRLRVTAAPARRSFIRFRVGRQAVRVRRATLILFSRSASGTRFRVRGVRGGRFLERHTSFARAPRPLRGARSAPVRGARGRWIRVEVTRLVRGRAVVDLALVPASRHTRVSFASSEVRRHAPRLMLRLAPQRLPAAPAANVSAPPPPEGQAPGTPGSSPPPAPASALSFRGRVGVAGATVWHEDGEQRAMLQRAREAGLEWIREDFHWGAFERQPGVWDWTVGDRLMRNAASVGINVLATVAYSADWAASGPTIYHPPQNPAAYANFCRRLVERYGPDGSFWRDNPSLTPRPLTAVEIWNEPWLEYFWRPHPDPRRYAALLRAAAAAVKDANPAVKVLASADIFQMRSDTTQSLDWFGPLLQEDPELFRTLVDAYSVHAYTQERSPLDTVTPQRWRFDRVLLTRDLAAQAGASHPIWITEFGWSTLGPDPVSEADQALYTRQALELAVREWPSIVEVSFLFYWGKHRGDELDGYSPLRADGSGRPLWDALVSLLR